MSTLIHDVSSSLKKSIVFFKYGLKLNLVKGERFDVYEGYMKQGDNLKILRTRKMFDLIDVCGFV